MARHGAGGNETPPLFVGAEELVRKWRATGSGPPEFGLESGSGPGRRHFAHSAPGGGETRRRINSAKVAATTQTRGVSPHHTPRTDRTLSRGTRNPLPNKKVHVLSARASDFEWPYRDERSLFTFWRANFLAGVFVCESALPGEFRVTQGVSFCLDAGLHRATRVGNSH